MNNFYVYLWTNLVNGKVYVGKGRDRRFREHLHRARAGSNRCPRFYRALRKYGSEAFALRFLAAGLSNELAIDLEIAAIAAWRSNERDFGYNITSGGEGASHVFTAEHRAKISSSRRGKKLSPHHRASLLRKKPPSLESLKRMATNRRGKGTALTPIETDAVRMLLSLGATGRDVAVWYGVTHTTVNNVRNSAFSYGPHYTALCKSSV